MHRLFYFPDNLTIFFQFRNSPSITENIYDILNAEKK